MRVAYLGEAKDEAAPRTRAVAHLRELEAQPRPPIVELRDVHAGYGTIDVLHGVSLTIAPGEVFALLGPNGAGKSTTLKVLNGEVQPVERRRAALRRVGARRARSTRSLGPGLCTIPEGRGIFPNLTVDDNLRMSTFTGRVARRHPGAGLHAVPAARANGASSSPARCRAVSSRCWRSPARSSSTRPCS